MRSPLLTSLALAVLFAAPLSCGNGNSHQPGFEAVDASLADVADVPRFAADGGSACVGRQCQVVRDQCAARGKPPTILSGVVYDPAGALPLYNVFVYVPNAPLEPLVPGHPVCSACQAAASGSPLVSAMTDAAGRFTLAADARGAGGVPSGDDVPLVVQVGKWRRQITVPHVEACADNRIPDPQDRVAKLRLPAKSAEGDMPRIAFTSGCDPAECFLRHIGIDDSEFVRPSSATGHVHFFTGQSVTSPTGAGSYVVNGNSLQETYAWWSDPAQLAQYDIVFNACECTAAPRGPKAYAAMHDYLGSGGRLFTTHFFYNWFAPPTGPSDFNDVALWTLDGQLSAPGFFVDTTFPKGRAFADWLQNNRVTTTLGTIDLVDTRGDVAEITPKATRWIYNAGTAADSSYSTAYMTFNTPVGEPPAKQCGRAVFSDVHLSGTSNGAQFPSECAHPDATYGTNEKALEFLFFDLSSCVQDDAKAPPPPPLR